MLSRWRKQVRDGVLRGKAPKFELNRKLVTELRQLADLRHRYALLEQEHELLKNRPRGLPRPICVETSGAYTEATLGQWPLAFWRCMSP
jgi:hypothetical protein